MNDYSNLAGKASETFKDVKDAASDVAGGVKDDLRKTADNASDEVDRHVSKTRADVEELKDAAYGLIDSLGEQARDVIRGKPIGALAAAATFGLLVGLATRR